jgi:hypothetical protein
VNGMRELIATRWRDPAMVMWWTGVAPCLLYWLLHNSLGFGGPTLLGCCMIAGLLGMAATRNRH